MSTRCNVLIKEGRRAFYLYHHHDGYPEGVGTDLKAYLESKKYWYANTIANQLIKGVIKDYEGKPDMEYEITSGKHGDIEYLYVINCKKKTLKCYRAAWDEPVKETIKAENEVLIP